MLRISLFVLATLSGFLVDAANRSQWMLLVAIGIAITAVISYLVLRAATRLNQYLGATGMNAIARIMGFLLVCIGVQFVINGVLDIVAATRAAA